MTGYVPPVQQQRYADTGRRQITILDRSVAATLARLKESEARMHNATHEIFIDRIPGLSPNQITGQTIRFGDRSYRVTKVMDPKAQDKDMRGRYLRLLCVTTDGGA